MTQQVDEIAPESNDSPSLAAVLLRTPFGALVLASVGSIPAAALTVGVQNWGDLLQRAPWWAIGVMFALLALMAAFAVSVHPTGRRLASWTIGMALGLSSALLIVAMLWTFAFASDQIEDWPTSTLMALVLAITSALGFTLAGRRVRNADDPRLLRSGHVAKGFLIPEDDPSAEILDRIDQVIVEVRELRADRAAVELKAAWSGPRWLGHLVMSAGWIKWQSGAVDVPSPTLED